MTNTQSKQEGARVRIPPPLVFLGLIGAGVVLQRFVWRASVLAVPLLRVPLGAVLVLAGLVPIIAAWGLFKRTGQDPAPWKPSPELLVRGVYRFSRNPMYVGMTLIQVGIGVASDNPWIAAFAPISLFIVHVLAVLPEEAYLAEKFGEGYLRYKAAVRRYL